MADKPNPRSPRRSLLFVPGDSKRKLNKVAGLAADAIILDLEDAVAVSAKKQARDLVCEVLLTMEFGNKERLVRVNSPATPFFTADLAAVTAAKPDGIVLPKVESARVLQKIDETLAAGEQARGWPEGTIRLLALIETAAGVMNIKEIAQATKRLDALLFGAEDLAADMGAVRTKPGWEVFYGRSAVVTAAAAYGLQAIDAIFVDFRDLHGLEEEAAMWRGMGYTGKMAIHPDQIAIINDVFSPSPTEIAAAQRLLHEAEKHLDSNSGVFTLDGRMVDAPMIRAAEQLLERARFYNE